MFFNKICGYLSACCTTQRKGFIADSYNDHSRYDGDLYNRRPRSQKTHKTAYIVGAILAAALLTFMALGAMHGVFGKGAEAFIDHTVPHTWHHTIVPLAKSPPFDLALAAIGGSLATLGIIGIVSKCRKNNRQYYC